MSRQALLALSPLFVWVSIATAACGNGDKTCLSGERSCDEAATCEGLQFSCPGDTLYIGTVEDLPGGLDLEGGEGAGADLVLQNDFVTVVFDQLAEPHGLAPTGGNILDMGERGGGDDLNLVYQIAGILPEDAFAYERVDVVDRSPEYVAYVFRGHLDGRDEVEVVTRYELHACESGLRVRSELYNGSPEPLSFTLSDVGHWGKRNALPFAPLAEQGFLQPDFELLELQEALAEHDYVLARAAEDDAPSYGFVACDRKQLTAVNSTELSAIGTEVQLIRPGEERSYQRYISVEQSPDLVDTTGLVSEVRRQLHGDAPAVFVRGRVEAEGLPVVGSVRRAAIVISEIVGNNRHRPLTTVMPGSSGTFTAKVPSNGWLFWELWSFGRVVASGVVPRTQDADLGTIEMELPATLNLAMTSGGVPAHGRVLVQPLTPEGREAVAGTWMGRYEECAPWLGPPVAGSPACNVINVPPQGTEVEIPAGDYGLYFTAGPDHTLARVDMSVDAGEVVSVERDLQRLEVSPAGWLSSDLHVHGAGSFDSSLPNRDRVHSFVAQGVDVIASTDHDFVTNYAQTIEALGVDDRVAVMGGLETTQLIPFMEVPGDDFPRVIGHFNHWPMEVDPTAPRGGAPWDELVEPGALFDRVAPYLGDEGIHMMNHPWDDTQFGRDLGFLRAIGYDHRLPIPEEDDGTRNGMLLRSFGGKRNIDFQLIEVQNGVHLIQAIKTRPLWFSFLSQGFLRTGTGNSDSHSLEIAMGYGRTYVDAGMSLDAFDEGRFNRALKEGRATAGNGVVVEITVGEDGGERRGLGFEPYQPGADDTLEIEVRAAPWVPVHEIRLVSSRGEKVIADIDDLAHPKDPLGSEGVVRYHRSIPLRELLDEVRDDWFLIEAGLPFFAAADLDDDGIVDTSDNNGDGVVDQRDVDEGEEAGPLNQPADPAVDEEENPRFYMSRVLPGAWSYGFTNPILVDWDGDGWKAPGLPEQGASR